jgi:hypothetical protein
MPGLKWKFVEYMERGCALMHAAGEESRYVALGCTDDVNTFLTICIREESAVDQSLSAMISEDILRFCDDHKDVMGLPESIGSLCTM